MSGLYRRGSLAAALLAAVVFVPTRAARADLELYIETTQNSVNYNSLMPSGSSSINESGVQASSDSSVSLSLNVTTNDPGSGSVASITMPGNMQITNLGGALATVDIFLTDTGFNNPSATTTFLQTVLNSLTVVNGASVSAFTIADPNNRLFATAGTVSNSNPPSPSGTTTAPLSSPGVATTTFTGTPPYSITMELQFSLPTNSLVKLNADSVVSSPEPATYALAITGLPLVGFFLHRRRRARASA